MIEILAAIGLIVVLATICSALEPGRRYGNHSTGPGPEGTVTQAQIHTAIAGAHALGLEAMEAGDEEMAHSWLKYSRELRAKL
jgi:hypothetical protein